MKLIFRFSTLPAPLKISCPNVFYFILKKKIVWKSFVGKKKRTRYAKYSKRFNGCLTCLLLYEYKCLNALTVKSNLKEIKRLQMGLRTHF